ncbi:MAG: 3-isopropylmalate dehydratase large subunit [Cellvibrionales bacterium]|nr:3-isopropylmalate dehydratase large subunit [Cellvibrionales bacterium]
MAKTLFEKLWQSHLVEQLDGDAALIYIDRILLHERTGSIALKSLAAADRQVRNPDEVFCVIDHIVDTLPGRGDETMMPSGKEFIQTTRSAAQSAGIHLFDIDHPKQGIVHVVSPEQGIVQPGSTLVCPDSHTCSQGALAALAWGIGSSEAEHALATKTLRINKPQSMRINFEGQLGTGVTAKDMILYLIAQYSAAGSAGTVIEFAGEAVRNLSIEGRLTLCNMAVEFSAFTGLIAADKKTIDYLGGRPYAPSGENWKQAVRYWQSLHSDAGAVFDREITIDCAAIEPMITWGNSPEHSCPITGTVPKIDSANKKSASMQRAQDYMGVKPGQKLAGLPIDGAFIGSCTNSRISDLRTAAEILRGRTVAANVRAICVPGSTPVKHQAEAEGLDKIFIQAGFEWRESGCSMCFYAGGESFGFQQRVATTTNRNFESRQGPQTRSHLASPATVAASALAGQLTDPRTTQKS